MEGHYSTGQNPQWAVVPMEEEEEGGGEEEEEERGGGAGGGGGRGDEEELSFIPDFIFRLFQVNFRAFFTITCPAEPYRW